MARMTAPAACIQSMRDLNKTLHPHCVLRDAFVIQAALEAVRQDIAMADNAPGGKVEFRRSLAASFLFKFFVHTSLKLEVGPLLT